MMKPYDVCIEVAYPNGSDANQDDARAYLKEKGYPELPYAGSRTEPTGANYPTRAELRGEEDEPDEVVIFVFSPFEI